MKFYLLLTPFLAMLCLSSVFAQYAPIGNDGVGWTWGAIEGHLIDRDEEDELRQVERIRYAVNFRVRAIDNISKIENLMIRPYLGYDLDEHSTIWVGYAFVPFEEDGKTYHEQRLVQMFTYNGELGERKAIVYYLRGMSEQRFFNNSPDEMSVRLRAFAKLVVPIPFIPEKFNMRLFVSDELLVNANSTEIRGDIGRLENRFHAGIFHDFKIKNTDATISVAYMHRNIEGAPNQHGISVGIRLYPGRGLFKRKKKRKLSSKLLIL
jgi:hypothetical protein